MVFKRILGKELPQNIGEQVVLLGKVGMMSPNGKYVELQTTDDIKVNVTVPEVIDGCTEGYLEVQGTVQSKSTLLANSYVHFAPEMGDLSPANYNELLLLGNLLGDKKWRFSEDSAQPF